MSTYNVMFVLGGPGAGKGTQCARIVKKYGFVHLSAGDLLRAERQNPESQVGKLIDTHIKNGSIVPVEITCSLLEKAMKATHNAEQTTFLIDGFPRNQNNLDGWNKQMNKSTTVKQVLFFDCPEKVCVDRCLERGKDSGRTDDNEESLKKRIQTYNDSTRPIIEHFQKLNMVTTIKAENSADQVFEDVQGAIDKLSIQGQGDN